MQVEAPALTRQQILNGGCQAASAALSPATADSASSFQHELPPDAQAQSATLQDGTSAVVHAAQDVRQEFMRSVQPGGALDIAAANLEPKVRAIKVTTKAAPPLLPSGQQALKQGACAAEALEAWHAVRTERGLQMQVRLLLQLNVRVYPRCIWLGAPSCSCFCARFDGT